MNITPVNDSPIYEVLRDMSDENLMKSMLSNMNNNDLCNLLCILDYMDDDTQYKWLDVYRKLTTYKF